MEIYNKKLIMLMSICLLFVSVMSHAKVRSVNTRRDFKRIIAKESMVVVLFYNGVDKNFMRMYENISKNQRYDDADVIFLKINSARKDLYDLARVCRITKMPAFIFFHKGKRLVNNKGKALLLSGFITQDQLQSYIDTYFGEEIEQYIAKKEARKQERIAQENESWEPYFYPRTMLVPGYDPAERNLE